MELTQLTQEIYKASQRLDKSSRALYKLAEDKANAESAYRIKLAQTIAELRDKGLSITLIPDLARGNEEVSLLKLKRDLAEDVFKSAIESKRSIEAQLSALQTISKYQSDIGG